MSISETPTIFINSSINFCIYHPDVFQHIHMAGAMLQLGGKTLNKTVSALKVPIAQWGREMSHHNVG